MSSNDPISELCTQIRNGQSEGHSHIKTSQSKLKLSILSVLKNEGYITDYTCDLSGNATITVQLKYFSGRPVISKLTRVSRPGCRIYKSYKDLPTVLGGLGVSIISTPQGVVTDSTARKLQSGGEVICLVE